MHEDDNDDKDDDERNIRQRALSAWKRSCKNNMPCPISLKPPNTPNTMATSESNSIRNPSLYPFTAPMAMITKRSKSALLKK